MRIGILLFDDVEELDFAGPLEVFGAAARLTKQIEIVTISRHGRQVRCRYGLQVQPSCSFGDCPALDLLIVPGGKGAQEAKNDSETTSFIRQQSSSAQIVSVCTGALILAEAGLLAGHKATTHHSMIKSLTEYPNVQVLPGVRYTREERVSTSAGISAGIDLAFAIVEDIFGNRISKQIAEIMEYEPKSSNLSQTKARHFIESASAPKILQMKGLETTILSGLDGEKMMMVLSATLPGNSVPTHSHPHEQVGVVCSGKAELRIGAEQRVVQKGDFYCIPANTPHSDTCIGEEQFVMLDVFYPIREDFVEKLKNST